MLALTHLPGGGVPSSDGQARGACHCMQAGRATLAAGHVLGYLHPAPTHTHTHNTGNKYLGDKHFATETVRYCKI